MAPRTKAKKNTDMKVSENEPVKKGRGKAKKVTEPDEELETESVEEKVAVTEKKNKRGKTVINYNEQDSNDKEEKAPPAKKSRKKNVQESNSDLNKLNGDNSAEENSKTPIDDQIDEQSESNGSAEHDEAPAAKGRKKAVKKEVKPKESGRGKKNVKKEEQEVDDSNEVEVIEEKAKGKGRGKKPQPKPESESQENDDNDIKKEQPAKGRKKVQKKPALEVAEPKKIEEEEQEVDDDNIEDDKEIEPEIEEPNKKNRKNIGKKATTKEKSVEKEEVTEVSAAKKRKGAKKNEKAKGDMKEELEDEEVTETKPVKGKRGQKKVEKSESDEVQDTSDSTNKRRRKDDKATEDNNKKPTKATTDYASIDFTNSSKNVQGKEWNFKISSWNVDGIRAWMTKGGLDYIKYEKPDILCLQEVKCSLEKLPEEVKNIPGYHAYWLCSDKDGYAGVGIYTTKLAMNVQYGLQDEELDSEGRIITAEYEQFYLICTYVPNAGRKLVTMPKRLKWNEEFRKYVISLDKKKPVIICGDMNVAHNEIDLTNPKTNKKNAGFTVEERTGMSDLLGDGFVDIYRHFYPDETGAYTFWTYMFNSRAKNVGWRLDYFIVSERFVPGLCDMAIRSQILGSDHCPISLFLHITSADKPKE